jgi:hypothetical protein
VQQILQRCNSIISKQQVKHLIQKQPTPPTLQARLKLHKPGIPIHPVVNNINTPTYKIAKHMSKLLKNCLILNNEHIIQNSDDLAQNVSNPKINPNCHIITYNIMDLYVNIPIQEVLHITKHFLNQSKMETQRKEQIIAILKEILAQNYFCFNNEFYQPTKDIAGVTAEIFLQYYEDIYKTCPRQQKHTILCALH